MAEEVSGRTRVAAREQPPRNRAHLSGHLARATVIRTQVCVVARYDADSREPRCAPQAGRTRERGECRCGAGARPGAAALRVAPARKVYIPPSPNAALARVGVRVPAPTQDPFSMPSDDDAGVADFSFVPLSSAKEPPAKFVASGCAL